MTVTQTGSGENIGFIWMLHEQTDGRQQCFLCDFAIWEPYRRKGFGAAALALAEKDALESECREVVLFVTDRNTAAKALYEKSGYRVLRQAGYGKYLSKHLA
jgi:ribosomal protein S18 acetylase RimI-like enzyme